MSSVLRGLATLHVCLMALLLPSAPGDYRGVAEEVFLSLVHPEACVDVEVEDDSAVESTENLTVSLSPLDGGLSVKLNPGSTTIYIIDNDGIVHLFVYFLYLSGMEIIAYP